MGSLKILSAGSPLSAEWSAVVLNNSRLRYAKPHLSSETASLSASASLKSEASAVC